MMKNEIIMIGDGVYQIRYFWLGAANVYCYLIVGDKRALLIDTGYATTHAKEYVQSVSGLPVVLVNTHGHFDHIGGNFEYEEAYLSEKDVEIAKVHSERESLAKMLESAGNGRLLFKVLFSLPGIKRKIQESLEIGEINWKTLPESGAFDLGGRKVSYFAVPGHTPGSICLFDDKTRFLFPGDMLCETGALLGFDYSSTVTEFKTSILKMKKFSEDNHVSKVYPSHHLTPATDEIFEKYMKLCDGIIDGTIKDRPYNDGLTSGYKAVNGDMSLIYRAI